MSLFETLAAATKPEADTEQNGSVPAFPRIAFGSDGCVNEVAHGLTKREHFAALAMQGILSSDSGQGYEFVSSEAVTYADALIKALNKE
jgi:hypothetical protein